MPYNDCLSFHYWLNFNSNKVHSAYNPYIHLFFFKCVFLHSALAREGSTVDNKTRFPFLTLEHHVVYCWHAVQIYAHYKGSTTLKSEIEHAG